LSLKKATLKIKVMIKRFLSCILLSLISMEVAYSQQGNLIVSTGIDPITQNVLPAGDPDPMWALVESPPAPFGWPITIGAPAFVIPQSNAWDATPSPSAYINAFNTNGSVTNNWDLTTQVYVFERPFCISNPNGTNQEIDVTFDLELHADNWAEIFFVDGNTGVSTSLLAQPYVYSVDNFLNPTNASNTTLSIHPGSHTLEIHLRNQQVVMGVSLYGELTSTGILADEICSPLGTIVGNTYHDVDGNNEVTGVDNNIAGMEISLYDHFGTLISTTTTDWTGFYAFRNLTPETYTVTESLMNQWVMSNPDDQSQIISVNTNAVTTVNFLNVLDLAVEENTLQEFRLEIYQNPNNGTVTLHVEDDWIEEVRAYDATGRLVNLSEFKNNTDSQVNIEGLTSGYYIVNVLTTSGKFLSQKLIVE
jgi:hypothetical protein